MLLGDPSLTAPSPTDPPPAVRLRGLRRSFGDVEAVRGVDLDLRLGEVVALLGPNGAGKTTTIDLVLGLTHPSAGTVEVLGRAPRDAVAHGLVAAVMQTGGLLRDLTVRETVAYVASLFDRSRPVAEVMERAGITDLAGRRVAQCSGGEQQRLRFALALLPDPALLVLDEPTTGMDVEGRRSFWAAVRHDAEQGRTVLFATHYLDEADRFADRIVLMSHGRVVADGSGAEVRALASGRTVRATIGDAGRADGGRALLAALRALAVVDAVELRGDRLEVHSRDSDAVARHLLTRTDARDLEVVGRDLEDAFVTLTSDGATRWTTR